MIPATSMTKGFKKFNEIMLNVKPELVKDYGIYISDSIDFISRYCSNLNFDKNEVESF